MVGSGVGATTVRLYALVVSREPATVEQLVASLRQLATLTDVCTDVSEAIRLLNHRKFEVVVVDLDMGRDAREVVKWLRLSPSNSSTVTFAIAGNKDQIGEAYESGSNFVLQRPLGIDSIDRTFSAAYGLIIRGRRRYFRCPVLMSVLVQAKDAPSPTPCQGVNISETGMCILTPLDLKPRVQLNAQFTLPGETIEFSVECQIFWCNQGRAGLRFVEFSSAQQSRLQEWLGHRFEEILPESVTDKFRGPQS
jgi:CheY-like chemotaxis protein